jgi:RNA polymerase-associated protein LEO1
MPNFVKFESQPFHPDTYRGPEADLDEAEQAESLRERSMSIKLEVENTIRWRWAVGEDGKKVRGLHSKCSSNVQLIFSPPVPVPSI